MKRIPKNENINTEYLKLVFLSLLINGCNDKLRHTSKYNKLLRKRTNLMLKEVYPIALDVLKLEAENDELVRNIELQLAYLVNTLNYYSFDELVNVNRILAQYRKDEYNIVIRFPNPIHKIKRLFYRIKNKLKKNKK